MQNMDAELPVERIWQSKLWLCTTHQFWCVVHNHGRTCQMRLTGSSAPIFWGRTRFWYSKWMHNRFWGLNIKKIDFALIFGVLAQPQIWGDHFQDVKNRRDINFFDDQTPKLICINFRQLNISPHAKYWGQTPWNELKRAKTVVVR